MHRNGDNAAMLQAVRCSQPQVLEGKRIGFIIILRGRRILTLGSNPNEHCNTDPWYKFERGIGSKETIPELHSTCHIEFAGEQ